MRKAIAAAMTRSKRTIPHFYLTETIDIDDAIGFLDTHNETAPPDERILLGAVLVRAATLAAAKVKDLNGHYLDDKGFVPSDMVNPGVAIALCGAVGWWRPALMDAGAMSLAETMAGMRDLVTRARAGRLRGSEMTQGTITRLEPRRDGGAEAMSGVIFSAAGGARGHRRAQAAALGRGRRGGAPPRPERDRLGRPPRQATAVRSPVSSPNSPDASRHREDP